MTLPQNAHALIASLLLASCVLPEQSAGFTPPSVSDAEKDPSGTKKPGISAGGSTSTLTSSEVGGASTGGGIAQGGTEESGGSSSTGGAAPAATGGASSSGGADTSVGHGGASAAGSTAAPCDYSQAVGPSCPRTTCAGLCGVSNAQPPDGTIAIKPKQLFGFRVVHLPSQGVVVALGAVTDVSLVPGSPGQFQLGLYEDIAGAPGALLGSTKLLKANSPDVPVEGAFATPVALSYDSTATFWIFMVTDSTNYVRIERLDVAQPEQTVYAYGVSCLPFSTPGCDMPATIPYSPLTVTMASAGVVPFLYARYYLPQ